MADITMCSGVLTPQIDERIEVCPFREDCYRYTAPVTPEWQSYFITAPYDLEGGYCGAFWKRDKGESHVRE